MDRLRAAGNESSADALMDMISQYGMSYNDTGVRTHYALHQRELVIAVIVSVLGPLLTFLLLMWQWYRAMGSGFWRLGRDVSLSPLELANAFFGGGGSVGGGGGAPRWMRQTDGVLSSEGISSGTLTPTSPQSDSSKSSVTVNGSDSGGYHQQQHLQHTLANILTGCSSNASADQIVKHIEKRAWAFNQADYWFDKKRIPRVQYGVDDQTGRLMFFIHGPRDGEDRKRAMVRPPVKGEKF